MRHTLKGNKSDVHCSLRTDHLLGQLQCDESLGLSFNALSPKFKFRVDGAMEDKIILEALSLKGTDWGVMANLLRHPPKAQIFSDRKQGQTAKCSGVFMTTNLCFGAVAESAVLPDELIGLSQ